MEMILSSQDLDLGVFLVTGVSLLVVVLWAFC